MDDKKEVYICVDCSKEIMLVRPESYKDLPNCLGCDGLLLMKRKPGTKGCGFTGRSTKRKKG